MLCLLGVASTRSVAACGAARCCQFDRVRIRADESRLSVRRGAYAAYGGVYIAASLVRLWLVEGQRPSVTDAIGAGIAIAGALVIIGFAPKAR
jgi:hypothetical protein